MGTFFSSEKMVKSDSENNQKHMQLIQMINANPLLLAPLLIWSLGWKGTALWKAGRNNQPYWFVALLIVNTVGLLEIIYIVWFQKKRSRA